MANNNHNEIRFEDKLGEEEMFIHSTKDAHVLVKDTKTEVVHVDMLRKVGVDHTLDVGGTYDVHVKGTETITVGADQTIDVTADRTKAVDGNETIKIGAARKLTTGLNLETAGSTRSLTVGAAQLDLTLGAIECTSAMVSTVVGGAVVKVTPRKMSEVVGSTVTADTVIGYLPESTKKTIDKLKRIPGVSSLMAKIPSKAVGASFQTVGLTKVELGSDRKIDVAKNYAEKIGMKLSLLSQKISDIAATTFSLKAADLLSAKGTEAVNIKIVIEKKQDDKGGGGAKADDDEKEIVIQTSDGSKLTLSSKKGITLESKTIHVNAPSIAVKVQEQVKIN